MLPVSPSPNKMMLGASDCYQFSSIAHKTTKQSMYLFYVISYCRATTTMNYYQPLLSFPPQIKLIQISSPTLFVVSNSSSFSVFRCRRSSSRRLARSNTSFSTVNVYGSNDGLLYADSSSCSMCFRIEEDDGGCGGNDEEDED